MKLLILAALAVATPAAAAPTYLSCTADGLAVEITANEAEQNAIVALPTTGRVVTRRALFSPTEVRILDEESTWVVDRVNLDLHRLVAIGDKRWDDKGKCVIKPAPAKRAF